MNRVRSSYVKFALVSAGFALGLSLSCPALADVPIVKTNAWELYTTGRVNAFFSYGFGDALPLARDKENIPSGGGLDTGIDVIPRYTPNGMLAQGTFKSMRVRSGFVPNVLGMGFRDKLNEDTTLKAYVAIWATLESSSQSKVSSIKADAREGYLKIDSHRWGSLTAGRALDLFSRGVTENDFLYGHGYGLGYPGNIDNTGPAAGLIGFGVLAAFFSPGLVYATPTLAGLQLSIGVYDPAPLQGTYESTRDARPEAELTFEATGGPVKVHLFANGAYQNFYKPASDDSVNGYGVGYGGRIEVGPVHLGVGGHYGKGLGLDYAFEAGDISTSPDLVLRTFDGYSALGQVALGSVDLNVGWGISRVFQLDSDKVPDASGQLVSLPQQWAISGGVVYHATDYLHLDVDFIHVNATWTLGESQVMNFINTGVTATW